MMTALYAAINKDGILSLGEAGMTVLTGILVVFCTLLLLTLVFYLFGWIMKPKTPQQPAQPTKPVAKSAPAVKAAPAAAPATAPAATDDETEIAAVIAAAVASLAPEGVTYTVQDIAPAAPAQAVQAGTGYAPRRRRSAWSASGLSQNVAPF